LSIILLTSKASRRPVHRCSLHRFPGHLRDRLPGLPGQSRSALRKPWSKLPAYLRHRPPQRWGGLGAAGWDQRAGPLEGSGCLSLADPLAARRSALRGFSL